MAHTQQEREKLAWEIARSFGEGVVPMFTVPGVATAEYISDVARTKQFLERFSLDSEFRALMQEDPQRACDQYGLGVNPEDSRNLWDEAAARKRHEDEQAGVEVPENSLSARRYQSFVSEKLAFRDWMRDAKGSTDSAFGRWRLQQMHRCALELGPAKASGLVHATVAFELQKGCSVGCWFCGVGAEKLTARFEYTEANARLWRDTLRVCHEVIGDTVFNGFCYWASDPLDNPDYLSFIGDFKAAFGRYPQTTTAIPLRDESLTRSLLDTVKDEVGEIQRFSILAKSTLDKIHAKFTPEELVCVELLPLNKESGVPKANAGKARKKTPKGHVKATEEEPQTIACVSGFLFNMVEQSVRMVTPCHASDRWPNGYMVMAEGSFTDGESLHRLLLQMIERECNDVGPEKPVSLNPRLTATAENGHYAVQSAWLKRTFDGYPAFAALDQRLKEGSHTAGELALELERQAQVPLENTFYLLNELQRVGALDVEPEPGRALLTV